ncbi:MAG: UvrD-helicase domain-containing protein [Deltaproteobacteria bacterium]|nr:UvrD-helicase domain-containing protein [Deltaproteobacteria bacterium]
MDYNAFVGGDKTLLVAPAGYGKTYTIVECLKHTTGRQLILTHTHAGVASIKQKIKEANIAFNRYNVETISSFAQKYVNAFYTGTDIPNQEKSREYHPFIIEKATITFKSSLIMNVIKTTYTGLFVDEYQDCTKPQHKMILALSKGLKTHILGDPLQGIFNFNGDLVDFDTDLSGFERSSELSIPFRWYQDGNNSSLGDWLIAIRGLLEQEDSVNLSSYKVEGLHVINVTPDDIRDPISNYRKSLNKLILNTNNNPDFNSLLIIVPEYEEVRDGGRRVPKGNIKDRAQIRAQIDYSKSLTLIEAIDDESFYSLARKIDTLNSSIGSARYPVKKIKKAVLEIIFHKSELNNWFNENGIKNKQANADKIKATALKSTIDLYLSESSSSNMNNIILGLKNNLKIKYKRDGLLYAILNTLKHSDLEGITVYEAMKNSRNYIRRSGRKIKGKCIGTTLLTKGLEFDTIAIMDTDKFDCPKHLYVALTRGCKNLFVFSSQNVLSPYK